MGSVVFSNMGNAINTSSVKWFEQPLKVDLNYFYFLTVDTVFKKVSERMDKYILDQYYGYIGDRHVFDLKGNRIN